MDFQSALHYWLQIRIVAEARPDDEAAKKTYSFFCEIIEQDFGVTEIEVKPYGEDDTDITLAYTAKGESARVTFDREITEKLLQDIEANPKYQ